MTAGGRACACAVGIGLLVLGWSGEARSQELPATPSLELVEMESGFALRPTFRLTEVDDEVGTLTGFQAGYLTDGRLFIGAAGHWLTSGSDAVDLFYGGAVVEWLSHADSRATFGVGGLAGFGSATLDTLVDVDGRFLHGHRSRRGHRLSDFVGPTTVRFRQWEEFFVAEPQASLLLHVTDWLRLRLGGGYRFVGSADGFDDRLRGFTAGLGVQIGP